MIDVFDDIIDRQASARWRGAHCRRHRSDFSEIQVLLPHWHSNV